ncbi:MAG: aminopeptidase P family protein [Theionarchaea archaeon]|nr:aminopeptidase P family protein [Theionarchaea archaeon]
MKSKLEQTLSILKAHDIDCWVILVREGHEKTADLLLNREFVGESAFIFTKDRKIAVVASYDRDRVEGMEIFTYTRGIGDILPSLLREISPGTISLNFSRHDHTVDSLTHGLFLKFQDILTDISFQGEMISSESFIEELRSVKTEEELKKIEQAVKITEDIFDTLPDIIHQGITERELLEEMRALTQERGCTLAWEDIGITFGMETELGHRIASERKLKKNESIHFDFGVNYEGYCSDLQRVFYHGATPPEPMIGVFETIRKAQDMALKAIKPGMKGFEIDAVARKIITENGYPEYDHGLGHQIGRLVHDGGCILGPLWERYEKNARIPIRSGNVFTIEPSISGSINMGLEDDIVVKEKAYLLSHPQKEIITL